MFKGTHTKHRAPPPSARHKKGKSSIVCPECGGTTQVVDSRPNDAKDTIRRRRVCTDCYLRFSTFEITYEVYQEWEKADKFLENMKELVEKLHG